MEKLTEKFREIYECLKSGGTMVEIARQLAEELPVEGLVLLQVYLRECFRRDANV